MKKLILGIVVLGLTGCSYIKHPWTSRDDEYLKAKQAPALQVPAGVSRAQFGTDYPVSGNNFNTTNKAVSLVPPGSLAASGVK